MENNQQNTTQPPTTKRRSIVAEVITGGVLGAIIGGIVSWFNKKSTTKRQIGIGAAIGVGAGLLSNLFAKKTSRARNSSANNASSCRAYTRNRTL